MGKIIRCSWIIVDRFGKAFVDFDTVYSEVECQKGEERESSRYGIELEK